MNLSLSLLGRRTSALAVLVAVVCAASSAFAQADTAEVSSQANAQTGVKLPYRGSLVIYEHSTRLWGFSGEELTYNPYYVHSLSFRPRWYFTDNVWARLQVDLEQELTDADDTTTANEVRLVGTSMDLNYSELRLAENLSASGRLTFGFPTDKISQLRTLYLSTGVRAGLTYRIPSVAKGLTLGIGAAFTKYFNRYADGDVDVVQYCTGSRGTADQCTATGVMNPNFRLVYEASATLQALEKLSFTASFLVYNTWAYSAPDSTIETASGEVEVSRSGNDTRLRALNRFTLDASYDITRYLGVSVGADTYTAQLGEDSTYRFPLFNRFTNFYVDLNLTVDELVQAVSPRRSTASLGPRTATASE